MSATESANARARRAEMTEEETEVYTEALGVARYLIKSARDGDPLTHPDGHASLDRKNNAQAALALVQAAKTISTR